MRAMGEKTEGEKERERIFILLLWMKMHSSLGYSLDKSKSPYVSGRIP